MQEQIVEIIQKAKAYLEERGGLRTVYFVGCGGSWASETVAACFVERENTSHWAVGHRNSSEFVDTLPRSVDGQALVIVTSMKATAESVESLRAAKGRGAYTIAITGGPETQMAKTADDFIVYTHSENWTCAFHSPAVALRLGVEILRQFEGYPRYEKMVAALDSLNGRYEKLEKAYMPRAIRFGVEHRNEPLFHVFSCGCMYGAGYTASYCHFAEMQQRNAIPLNCGEYFHGAFETTVPEQPSVLFMGLGKTRPMDERAKRFLTQFCDKLTVVDAAEFGLEDLDEEIAEYIAPLLLSPLFKVYVERLAEERQHPMTMRRYMWKMDY